MEAFMSAAELLPGPSPAIMPNFFVIPSKTRKP